MRKIYPKMKVANKQAKFDNKQLRQGQGITLIALVVTIIVLLILAGVTIATLTGDSGIITKADESKISTELAGYKEQLDLYIIEKYNEDANFEEETLTAGKTTLNYNTKPSDEEGNIKTIIEEISDEYFEKLEVIKGELLINTIDENEIRVAQRLGIKVNPYDIRDGVLWSANGNLALMGDDTGSLTIPDSVTAIGQGAFSNVEGLKTIIIPSTVKRIERDAFRNNSTLETVIMQEKVNDDGSIEGVEYIGDAAFKECDNLKTVQMANSVTEVGTSIFQYDNSLKTINISDKITIISVYMFHACTSLETIEIPDSVVEIGNQAFNGCSNLMAIKIPKSVTTIGATAFNGCSKLTNIDLSENTNFRFENGILLGKSGTEMLIILQSAVTGNTFKVPDTVTSLSVGQIDKFTNITKVEIPASVDNIYPTFITKNITEVEIDSDNETYETDGKAIYTKDENNKTLVRYYKNENSVNIEKQIKKISFHAFNSKSLSSIELPDSLETIESGAFTGCNNLKSIELGVNVKSLDNMSIYSSGIEKITFKEDSEGNTNPNYSIRNAKCNGEETDALFNSDGTVFISPIKRSGIKTYEIPKGVKEIANFAFHNQTQMTNIIIPNTVEKIGASFNYCTALTSIEIPNSVKEINTSCFANSTNLREIRIHQKNDGTLTGSPWGCIYGDKAIIWDE